MIGYSHSTTKEEVGRVRGRGGYQRKKAFGTWQDWLFMWPHRLEKPAWPIQACARCAPALREIGICFHPLPISCLQLMTTSGKWKISFPQQRLTGDKATSEGRPLPSSRCLIQSKQWPPWRALFHNVLRTFSFYLTSDFWLCVFMLFLGLQMCVSLSDKNCQTCSIYRHSNLFFEIFCTFSNL